MNISYTPKTTKRFEKSIKALSKEKMLAAEVITKIDLLVANKKELLDIVPIVRKHGKYNISEIRIHWPQHFRVFFVYITIEGNDILLIDGVKKKQRSLPSKYFEGLDDVIDNYVKENTWNID